METVSSILSKSRGIGTLVTQNDYVKNKLYEISSNDDRMNKLWINMSKRFGLRRWTSQFGKADDGSWARALSVFNDQTITTAIDIIVISTPKFLPGLSDFITVCFQASGLPESSKAYEQATLKNWIHPVIYETAIRVGIFNITNKSEAITKPIWQTQFNIVCFEYLQGNAPWLSKASNFIFIKNDKPVYKKASVYTAETNLDACYFALRIKKL